MMKGCQHHGGVCVEEFNMAEKIFSTAQHIDIQSYMQYVKEDIIPYIYKFQELLYKSHQIAKEDALN